MTPAELRLAIERMSTCGYDDVPKWQFVAEPPAVVEAIRRAALIGLDVIERGGEQLGLGIGGVRR